MDEPARCRTNLHWRRAVRTLRVGYVALAVAFADFVVLLVGSTPWVLAAGMCTWLVCVAIVLFNFLRARSELGEARPKLWSLRVLLVKDTMPARRTAHG